MTRARLMSRPEDFKRIGITPGVVEAWEDGRRDTAAPGHMEVWSYCPISQSSTYAAARW